MKHFFLGKDCGKINDTCRNILYSNIGGSGNNYKILFQKENLFNNFWIYPASGGVAAKLRCPACPTKKASTSAES